MIMLKRFNRYFKAAVFAAGALLLSTAVHSAQLPEPTADFTADMHVDNGMGETVLKVQRSGDKQRVEMAGAAQENADAPVMILRKDKKVVWRIIKSAKAYTEIPFDDQKESDEKKIDFKLEKEKVETVNGVEATKFKVSANRPQGGTMEGHIWFTKENIMIKMDSIEKSEGKPDINIKLELKNLKVKKINASVFDLPNGYNKMTVGTSGNGAAQQP